MTKFLNIIIFLILILIAGIFGWWIGKEDNSIEPISQEIKKRDRPLDKYTIESLANTKINEGRILLQEVLKEEKDFTSYLFSFTFNPNLDGQTLKQATGQINIPTGDGPFPLVVMFRGYIDQETYKTGDGTKKAAAFFAKNGLITAAPDFLGYGESDSQAKNIFEARFQTYVTVLSLMKSLDQIESWDEKNVFIWGHSNGGQIAITYLEITGSGYPTALWAPVSKSFPYSVLYYTDESEDRGKLIRRELAKFEELYNSDLYAIDLYLDRIKAPLILHQGTVDESVPQSWSDKLSQDLLSLGLDLNYFLYPNANHNMVPNWDTAVSRDLEFFNQYETK